MIKSILKLILITAMISCVGTPLASADNRQEIRVFVDGQQIPYDVNPTIVDGRTLVPVRATFEALGAQVKWEPEHKLVEAVKDDVTLKIKIGSSSAAVNGETSKLDVSPRIIEGRTLIPLRFVSEAFGTQVGWEYFTRTITIHSLPTEEIQITKMLSADTFVIIRKGQADTLRLVGVRTVDHTKGPDPANGIYSEYLSWFSTLQYISRFNHETKQNEFIPVRASFDQVERDELGNLLGYVFLESGEMLNALLIQQGSARTKVDSENKTWLKAFYYLESVAFGKGRGGWGKQEPFPEYEQE